MRTRRSRWKNWWLGRRNKSGEGKQPRRFRFPSVESLEPRVLLSGNPYLSLGACPPCRNACLLEWIKRWTNPLRHIGRVERTWTPRSVPPDAIVR
jgi:hypothetical protein